MTGLYRSEYSGLRDATTQVVSEPAAWADLWATTADTRTLFVSTYAPGPGCVTTQALSQPVHVVAAPRHAGPTTVATQAHTLSCS